MGSGHWPCPPSPLFTQSWNVSDRRNKAWPQYWKLISTFLVCCLCPRCILTGSSLFRPLLDVDLSFPSWLKLVKQMFHQWAMQHFRPYKHNVMSFTAEGFKPQLCSQIYVSEHIFPFEEIKCKMFISDLTHFTYSCTFYCKIFNSHPFTCIAYADHNLTTCVMESHK